MDQLGILIPIIALSIPLVAVIGGAIVKPIVKAISESNRTDDARVKQLAAQLEVAEERLERMERTLRRVEEAQDFHRQLARPPSDS